MINYSAQKSINTTEIEYLPVGEVQVSILTTCETKAAGQNILLWQEWLCRKMVVLSSFKVFYCKP